MELQKSNHKINNENNNNNKVVIGQKVDSELKRFKSHEVYLVTQKKPKKQKKNENTSKDHKKIFIKISQGEKVKPKPKKSFNNNSNTKPSKNRLLNNTEFIFDEGKQIVKTQKTVLNKSKTKISISTKTAKDKHKLTVNNYINSINAPKNKINTSKILNEESIQEIDSEDNNINIVNLNKTNTMNNTSKTNESCGNNIENNNCNIQKNININNKNNYTNNINMNLTNNYFIDNNGNNKVIKKINFDELHNSSNSIALNNIVNKNDEKNRELLLISKKGDKEKLLELLCSNQVNINFQDDNGWSAMHFACDEGNLKIVEILIKSKIDLNLRTSDKKTALHFSVLRGYFDISKLLIENGASINIRDNEKNLPIHLCANKGHDELLTFILEKNSIGIKAKNLYGKTPLDMAEKDSTKEIINKFLNLKKKKNKCLASDKDKNSISPELNNGNNNINHYNSKNQFSRIKIHKTNKNLVKSLMTPIGTSHLNNYNNNNFNNNQNHDQNDIFKANNSKNNINKGIVSTNNNTQEINASENLSNHNTIAIFNTGNSINTSAIHTINNTINNDIKNPSKINQNSAARKNSNVANQDNRPNKVKIDLSSSSKNTLNNTSINNYSNNNSINNSNNNSKNNTNRNNNSKNLSNNTKYLNYASSKRKAIFNIHISSKNNMHNNNNKCINKLNSPTKDSFMRYNTSSNMNSSSLKIYSTSNNNSKINDFPVGNDIFFGNEKEKVRGKIINIPKKINNKKENSSQSKKKKVSSVWKTVTQADKTTPKFSPNIKCMGKPKKKTALFKKEDSKILNNLSSKRTVSVPRFLDTEYILEKNSNKRFKREESAKNKYKVPNKNNNNSNNNLNNKYKDINNYKSKAINNNVKNMKKQNSNTIKKNKKCNVIGLKNRQIYTEEDANLIDDLEEEIIIEIKKDKDKEKDNNFIKNKSKEIKTSKTTFNNINNNNTNGNIKKNQINESDDDFDDIEELEDSFEASEDSDTNKEEKIGPSNFVCLALLGQGSFGEVYLVQKKDSNDFYAMKVLDKCRIAKQNIFKYVLTERNVLSAMHNPFIVKLNYAFQTSEKLFLLLDYCPGGDLSKQLQIQTRFSEEKAKFYICEIILALGALHKNNIIFRDLKPDNVVIDKEGHALLTDFGLSREVVGQEIAKSFCGSIAYLAPEMLNRSGHGKAVDWYLLGVLFYELLVGVPPYFTANQEQIFKNIQKAELYIPPFISEKAKNLIKSLLKRNPNERLGSKRDVEEIKENEYFADVDWQKVYERKYKPPQIYLKSNHLQFFRQPVQFKENEEDDLFVKEDNYVEYNKYNQDILNTMNNYDGWSFIQKNNNGNIK